MYKKVIPLILVMGITFTQSWAQESPVTPSEVVPSLEEVKVAPVVPLEVVEGSADGNVSLDFRDADIRNVLKVLAYKSGVNIIAGPEVTGVITIQLKDIPWQQALDVILATYGYGYDRRGNIITVTTIENLKKRREDSQFLTEQEPLSTRIFTLNFGQASELIQTLEKIKTPRGSIDFNQRTNTLIVRDITENLELMEEVVSSLDTVTPQVLIEAKIVETNFSNGENLGVDWITKVSVTGAARPHIYPFTTATSSKYTPDNFSGAADADFTYGTLDFNQVQAVFEMLKTRTDTNILSNPRIVTLDNQSASIVVGSQYPIPTYTYNEDQGKLQVSGWEYKDIGIIFNVTPQVNKAGFVTLQIEPQVTDILDYVTVENTQLPRLSTESAKTNVMIKDGETLVIAGLVKDHTKDVRRKIPILGDIPILGFAFQKKEKTITKTDLLIFITPHIITAHVTEAETAN